MTGSAEEALTRGRGAEVTGKLELCGFDIDGKDFAGPEGAASWIADKPSPPTPKRRRHHRGYPSFVQGMEGGGGGAHHDGALLEGDFIGQAKNATSGNGNEFGISAIAMFADHFAGGAELFVALVAIRTVAAGSEVMEADAVARFELARLLGRIPR